MEGIPRGHRIFYFGHELMIGRQFVALNAQSDESVSRSAFPFAGFTASVGNVDLVQNRFQQRLHAHLADLVAGQVEVE